MKSFDLSIVVCTFKRLKFLKKKIKEFKEISDVINVELVLVIENNDKKTLKYLKNLKIKNSNYLINQNNNVNYAADLGIKNAKGKYVCIHGDDDFFDKKNLKYLKKNLKFNHSWIIGYGKYINDNNVIVRKKHTYIKNFLIDTKLKFLLKSINYLMCPSVFLKRKTILDFGGYPKDCQYGSDHKLWIDFIERNALIIKKNLSYSTYSEKTISGKFNFQKYLYLYELGKKKLNIFEKFLRLIFLILKIIIDILKKL